MDTVTGQKWLIGIFSVLLIVVLIIVAAVEMKKTRLERPEIEISVRASSLTLVSTPVPTL